MTGTSPVPISDSLLLFIARAVAPQRRMYAAVVVCVLLVGLAMTSTIAAEPLDYVPGSAGTRVESFIPSAAQIVFSSVLPNSVFRTVDIPVGGADVAIFGQDCCIRDDVVEIYLDGCFLARVDSRGGADGTHPGETHLVSLSAGPHTVEYRNVISIVGPSGWNVSEALLPFTGEHPCGIKTVQVICRPLAGSDALCHLNARVGRHCYFLLTDSNDNKSTFGAYSVNGNLQAAKNGDPLNPPGGCGDGALGSDCISVSLPSGITGDDVLAALQQTVDVSYGTYDKFSNNSNLWAQNRINELGLGITLPATAITSLAGFCTQLPHIKQSLHDECGLTSTLIDEILLGLYGPTCP